MPVLVVVPARGGSKGVPRKNMAELNGVPLVAHAVKRSLEALADWGGAGEVVVSTDSQEIQEAAVAAGADCPQLRPAELAGDLVPSLPVVQHAVAEKETRSGQVFDVVVLVQATSPLWRTADFRRCLEALEPGQSWDSAVLVAQVATHPFRMKRMLDDGRIINLIDQGFEDMRPRQTLPPVFRRAGSVYASRRDVVMVEDRLVGQRCLGVEVPSDTAVDIDTPSDLALVRVLHDRQEHT